MHVKGIIEEDFTNFKLPSMFINTCYCDFKCCNEYGLDVSVCQNSHLAQSASKEIPDEVIYKHFVRNPITKAVVIGGLEPFLQTGEVEALIRAFRENEDKSPFIIYTGYYPDEVKEHLEDIKPYNNIIVKFGRFVPNSEKVYDDILGIWLSSKNQFAIKIS